MSRGGGAYQPHPEDVLDAAVLRKLAVVGEETFMGVWWPKVPEAPLPEGTRGFEVDSALIRLQAAGLIEVEKRDGVNYYRALKTSEVST